VRLNSARQESHLPMHAAKTPMDLGFRPCGALNLPDTSGGQMHTGSALPLISVITPVLNGERYIAACIDNVVSQQYPAVEHIVVDGASTDRTVSIVERLKQDHSHIRLISEKDRGLSDALNKGISAASADYVGILNIDDFYEPGVLTRVGELIQTLSVPHFLVANCNVRNDHDQITSINRPRFLEIEKLLMGVEFFEHPYNPSAYFYPRDLHKVAGLYDITDNDAMDLRFILSAVQHIPTMYFDEVWGNFRFMEGTKTFEDHKKGTADRRRRRVYRQIFLQAPMKTKMRVARRWLLYRALWNVRPLRKMLLSKK